MYFIHSHSTYLSDNVFQSIFYYCRDSSEGTGKENVPVHVKIKKSSIVFFILNVKPEAAVSVSNHVDLFMLPLDTPEDTNYFLLNCREQEQFSWNVVRQTTGSGLYYKDVIPNKSLFDVKEKSSKYVSIPEMLLCLFDELDNKYSDLNRFSPELANEAKISLNKSSVYQSIHKKFKFYRSYYELNEPSKLNGPNTLNDDRNKNSEQFKNKLAIVKIFYNDYLQRLLSDCFLQDVPIDRLSRNYWLQNPQIEIEELIKLKVPQDYSPESKETIKKYFLSKHAVLGALRVIAGTTLSSIIVAFQLLAFASFLFIWICWLLDKYDFSLPMFIAGASFFFISLVLIFLKAAKGKFFDLLMPRILVSITSVLFLTASGEELLKKQLASDHSTLLVAIIATVVLLPFFIYTECRRHSPYYKFMGRRLSNWKALSNWKVLPIIIYTFNTSVFLVLAFQLLFMRISVGKNMAMKSNIFSSELDSLRDLRERYSHYVDKLEKAREASYLPLNLSPDQRVSYFTDVSNPTNEKGLKAILYANLSNPEKIDAYYFYYSKIFRDLKISDSFFIHDLQKRRCFEKIARWQTSFDSLLITRRNSDSLIKYLESWIFQLEVSHAATNEIYGKISNLFFYYNNPKNLDSLLTYSKGLESRKGSDPDYGLSYNAKGVCILKFSASYQVYPRIFMIQVILVTLIAIISQLVMSGKVITEPI